MVKGNNPTTAKTRNSRMSLNIKMPKNIKLNMLTILATSTTKLLGGVPICLTNRFGFMAYLISIVIALDINAP